MLYAAITNVTPQLLLESMLVEDVMTTDVATVDEDAPLLEAVEVMLDRGIGSVVATTGSPPRKTGILTDIDVKRAVSQVDGSLSSLSRVRVAIGVLLGVQRDKPLSVLTVRESMSPSLVTVSPDMPLSDAVVRMKEERVSHLVVTKQMNLEGIVTPTDIGHDHDDIVREVRQTNARRPNWNE